MFLVIGLVLLGIWLIGFGLFRAVVGGIIHVVLIFALFALVWHFVSHASHATGGRVSANVMLSSMGAPAPSAPGHVHAEVVVT
jgi:uncharacterized protein DUF5670